MRTYLTVVFGLVACALALFAGMRLFRLITGGPQPALIRPANRALADTPSGVPAPIGGTTPATPPVASRPMPALQPLPAAAGSDIAIPVVGVDRAALHDNYDDARAGHVHHAIDIAAARGTPVIAAVDGTVEKLFLSAAGGITLYEIDDSGSLIYYYAHLEGYAPGIVQGRRLRRGEILGFVGTTGNAPPNAPHLHFAIERVTTPGAWWKGEPVNPYPILAARGVTWAAPTG